MTSYLRSVAGWFWGSKQEQPAEEVAQEPTEETIEETAQEVAQEPTEEVAQEHTEEPSEQEEEEEESDKEEKTPLKPIYAFPWAVQITKVKRYLNLVECTAGRSNKIPIVEELMAYLVENRDFVEHHAAFRTQVWKKIVEFAIKEDFRLDDVFFRLFDVTLDQAIEMQRKTRPHPSAIP